MNASFLDHIWELGVDPVEGLNLWHYQLVIAVLDFYRRAK